MANPTTSAAVAPIVTVPQALWVARVLSMLVAVVGRDSILGVILRQARTEIVSLTRDERPGTASFKNN